MASVAPRDQPMSRQAIVNRIADGQTIVIFEDCVLRLDSWLEKHPGGKLAIQHMVGRDATDEMKISHSPSVVRGMKAYRIGRLAVGPAHIPWHNLTPPVRGGVYTRIDDDNDAIPLNLALLNPNLDTADASSTLSSSSPPSSYDSSSAAGDVDSDVLDGDVSDQSSVTTDCSVNDALNKKASDADTLLRRRLVGHVTSSSPDALAVSASSSTNGKINLTRTEYADLLIEKEADDSRNAYPSVDPAIQADIVRKYRALHQRVIDDGLYQCHYSAYMIELSRYTALFATSMTALHFGWYMTSAVFLGLFWHQIMFTAHDAGHCAITHHFETDALIGLFIADFCCGLSMGWWKSSHTIHHLITNDTESDPDIQNVPLFANCPSFFKSLPSTYYEGFTQYWDAAADFMVPYQKYTYYPVLALARFNLFFLSWLHVASNRSGALRNGKAWWIRPTEVLFMSCYWFLYGYCLVWRTLPNWPVRVAFVLVSHIVTLPLHVQITLSHWGMPTANIGESESFPQRQLRTTMDVDCPAWLDWIHGGLQFQAVHHLFPRVPRHNLRTVQGLVREFSKETGIKYSIHGFVDGNKVVLSRLEEVAKQVETLVKCQLDHAKTGDMDLH